MKRGVELVKRDTIGKIKVKEKVTNHFLCPQRHKNTTANVPEARQSDSSLGNTQIEGHLAGSVHKECVS